MEEDENEGDRKYKKETQKTTDGNKDAYRLTPSYRPSPPSRDLRHV